MKRWRGWGKHLISILSPEFKGRGQRHMLRGAGIGTHEVVAGHTTAGELRRLVEKFVPGGGLVFQLLATSHV